MKNNFLSLPAEVKAKGRFVVYKIVDNGKKKPAKVPYKPAAPSRKASHTNPAHWSDFATALAVYKKHKFDGINVVCSPKVTCVDLDHCVTDGKISAEARQIIKQLIPSYWEFSPSGTGLRGIFSCDEPFDGIKNDWKEAYSGGHFMSVTGNRLPKSRNSIAGELPSSFEFLRKPVTSAAATVGPPDKLELLIGGRFSEAGFPSASEADASLCSILARKGLSRDAVEGIWLQSGLNRDKLERDDYRKSALDFAFAGIQAKEAYSGDGSDWPSAFPAASDFDDDEFPERHLIKDLIGYQQVVAIPGAPEARKTLGVLEMCKALLLGVNAKAFGHFAVKEPVDGVIYYIPEMSRAAFIRFARYFKLNSFGDRFRFRSAKEGATLPLDDPRLQKAVKGRVLVLDTLLYFSGAEDSYKATEWLWFSQQCRRLIEEFDCRAIILLHHPTKAGAEATDMDLLKFISQSIALAGLIDTCFGFRRAPDNDTQTVVKCLKAREWENRPQPFIISSHDANGKSFISQGEFPCTGLPGTVDVKETLKAKSGPKPDKKKEEWLAKAKEYKAKGMSFGDISKQLRKDGYRKGTSETNIKAALKLRKFDANYKSEVVE